MAKFVVKTNRELKAKKIEAVLLDFLGHTDLSDSKILDIGCGTGEIISFFKKNGNTVCAVDAMDQRLPSTNIDAFHLVSNAKLPFESEQFDVVISNHVIEHIENQELHLSEIHRCLKPNGVCYFATPNWNFPIEPHHRIPFIHYLGKTIFHSILRTNNLYEEDLFLLSYCDMKKIVKKSEFKYCEYTAKTLKNPERYHQGFTKIKKVPISILKLLQKFSQTNIFILRK